MHSLFEKLGTMLKAGKAAVLVTVVASSGSTPREAGARMLVGEGGRVAGTIGGGAVEAQSEEMALRALQEQCSHTEQYRLHQNEVQDLGMICGGEVEVYFRYIPAGDAHALRLADEIANLYQRDEPAWLVEELAPGQNSGWGLYRKEGGFTGVLLPAGAAEQLHGASVRFRAEGRAYFAERLLQPGRVYIFGGGHVSQALAPVLAALDFRCVILEDRPEFAAPALFRGTAETRLIDNSCVSDFVSITEEDYVVIMTRGHKDDQTVQAQMLRTPARYIGVIGSKRKAATVFANLREMGFADGDLARIITPIGLDIAAETPQEIAISIAAQLIAVRAGAGSRHRRPTTKQRL